MSTYKLSPELKQFLDYKKLVHKKIKNFEFIKNSVGLKTETKTVDWLEYQYNNFKIVSLAPHLQRVLLKDVWGAKNNKKAKSYIRSIWIGFGELTAMTVVGADVVLNNINEILKKEKNVEVKEQIEKVRKAVEDAIKNGADYINIDGQSRSECGIIPYLKSEFNLSDDSFKDPIDVYHPKVKDVRENDEYKDITIHKFGDLDDTVKGLFLSQNLKINIITKGTLKQVSGALIAINSNEKWKEWQKVFCNANPSIFKARINQIMENSPLKDFLKNKMKQESDRYKVHYSGLELFAAESLSWLKKKSTPNIELLEQMMDSVEPSPNTSNVQFFEKIMKIWLNNYTTENKVKPIVLSTHIDFMDVLSKSGDKNDAFYSQFGTVPNFKILSDGEFLEWYLKTVQKFEAKTQSNSSHWWQNPNTQKWGAVQDGWPSHCAGSIKAASKVGRIKWLLDALKSDMDELLKNRVLSSIHNMPDMPTVMVHNKHIDSEGKEINLAKTKINYEKGHKKSKAHGGDNSLENLTPQRKKSNRQYNKKDIVTA
jgi:hypothetical protein